MRKDLILRIEPHWIDGLSNEQYHQDRDYVSSSQLKMLIEHSPAYFYNRVYEAKPKPATEAMKLSTLVHHANLEGEDFIKRYVVMPKFDGRTTVGKQSKAAWIAENRGKISVTEEEIETLQGTYESIHKHPDASLILKGSEFERSGYYVDAATGIPCRIRFDAYDHSSRILSDIKAVRSCKREHFAYAVRDYRWDLSMAMYGQGIKEINGHGPDDYVFIAIEKEAPYEIAVYPIGKRTLEIGLSDYRRALEQLRSCRESRIYPGYQSQMEEIDLPESFMRKYL